jgi:predicted kinase
VLSSDKIREELYGDESIQDNPEQVFKLMFERTVENLNNGLDVIYDATNLNRKKRINLLDGLKRKVKHYFDKYCFVVYCDIGECLQRNKLRDRHVPEDVIFKMLKSFEIPVDGEGWNKIEIKYSTDPFVHYSNAVNFFCGGLKHDNPHHLLDIDQHMYAAEYYLSNIYKPPFNNTPYLPIHVKYATLFHDIGKSICKTYKNKKGEESEIAHYYNHANAGAYLSLGINFNNFQDETELGPINKFTESNKYYMAVLINFHMRPLEAWKESKKAYDKDCKLLGDNMIYYLKVINECDTKCEYDKERS